MRFRDLLPWRRGARIVDPGPQVQIAPSKVARQGLRHGRGPVRRIERTFAAAERDRLTASFNGVSLTADEALVRDLRTMRIRSRQLAQDYPHARKFLWMLKQNVVGPRGIKLRATPKRADGRIDTADKQAIERAWNAWGRRENCTVDKRMTWADVQRLAIETIAKDGEVLIRLVPAFANRFAFAIQVMEADHLNEDRNVPLSNGWAIKLSVEQNAWGEPQAYHISQRHPGERQGAMVLSDAQRIAADQILHPYIIERPGQSRGVPWMHAVIRQASILSGYQEAELVHARAASSKMGFIETETGEDYETGVREDDDDDESAQISDFEPGLIEVLKQGQKFTGFDPTHPTTAYGAFVKDVLRGFSAGLNVSYHSLAADLESVNFSSSRTGLLDERDFYRLLQGWFCSQVCQPIYEIWLLQALIAGAVQNDAGVPLPVSRFDKFASIRWQGRGWAWVKPIEDTQAHAASVAAGFRTSSDVVEELTGEDLETVYDQLREEQQMREERGLTATVNPASVGITVKSDAEETAAQGVSDGSQD